MIVMGGIVGAGIFINPYVVAQQVHTPVMILGVWIIGGVIAMLGAFVYAELAARRLLQVGGQYAYLREAFHPVVGFLYGWVLLLVIQTGGMAAVTVTFARYLLELTGWRISERLIVAVTIVLLTVVNCMGVKLGSRMQSVLMVLKIAAIAGLIGAGLFLVRSPQPMLHPVLDRAPSFDLLTAVGAAMVPVLFAFGGWQTTNFIAEEIKDPRTNLSRALVLGVAGVIVLYVGVNFVCVRTLGAQGLADTRVPATAVMRVAMGESGARLIALGVAVSTLGFLSQSVLTAPRVYFAMARDGLFFRSVAKVTKRTHVPALAIVLQSIWTIVVALSGRYDQILNYVVSMDFLFFGLTGLSLFVFLSGGEPRAEMRRTVTALPDIRSPLRCLCWPRGWWSSTPSTNILRIACLECWSCCWVCRCMPSGQQRIRLEKKRSDGIAYTRWFGVYGIRQAAIGR